MFRSTLISASGVLFCLGTWVILGSVCPRIEDRLDQEKLLQKGHSTALQPELEQTAAHQQRTFVQKDFWLQKDGRSRHIRIASEKSDLWIQPQNKKFCLTEKMEPITCCAQDLLKEQSLLNHQEIQWLTAKKGTFTYPSYHFEASDVALSIFSLPNNTFPETIPEIAPHSAISADFADWTWPESLHLLGNVHLFSQALLQENKTYACADKIIFDPTSGGVQLIAEAPNKVLLWQDEMRLSSPLIEIQKDAVHKTECIKGIGDVHFYFTGEEETLFNEIFGHNLL